jgi:hypothetical protein
MHGAATIDHGVWSGRCLTKPPFPVDETLAPFGVGQLLADEEKEVISFGIHSIVRWIHVCA